jgi:hypothetical protein
VAAAAAGRQGNRLPCEALTDGMTLEIDADDDFEPDAIVRWPSSWQLM